MVVKGIKHPYHLVDVSPWPIIGAMGSFLLVAGMTRSIHKIDHYVWPLGLTIILITITQWWRDVCRESTYQGKHTGKVENGLRTGILMFITREVCFFFAFFWAFFHSSLRPNSEVGSAWPPKNVVAIEPLGVPLLNTTVLLTSGSTITWAHIALINSDKQEASFRLNLTIILGIMFTVLQILEYSYCPFTIADSIYGRTFYLATGFHGFHVIIGTFFIVVISLRLRFGHFSSSHHFGFEGRAWYWHFVDVVWLFLFIRLYWWGY